MILIHLLQEQREHFLLLVEHRDNGSHSVCISDVAVPHQFLQLLFCLINASVSVRLVIAVVHIESDSRFWFHILHYRSQMICDADEPFLTKNFIICNVVDKRFELICYLGINILWCLGPLEFLIEL